MKKVLIVDDEAHLRLLYEMELRHAGYSTMTVASAIECLELIETRSIDLVILDLWMSGMDGVEVLQKLNAQRRGIPVIIHSAFSRYRDHYLNWGAAAYLIKSSDMGELIATVDRLLKPETRASHLAGPTPRPELKPTERKDHVAQTL